MALFQPSNIIPSSFGGVDETTVDVSANVKISWQVNGNSAMSAFKIQIFDNLSTSTTAVYDSGVITSYFSHDTPPIQLLPFYGVDNKGNPKQFTYEPISTTWSSWELSNGNEYKMIITQYWGTGNTNSITQYSGSVFYTREKPTLTMKYNGNTPIDNAFTVQQATATFTADLSIQTIAINAVRWVVKDNAGMVLDDTGFINTPILSYTYDGLFTGNTYTIECAVETENQVSVTTGVITLNVSYAEAQQSGDLMVDCQADDSVLVSWNTATNIPGKVMENGEEVSPTISNGYLSLADGQTAEWNKVDDQNMDFPNPFTPYSLAWKGKIGSIITKDYQITTAPTVTTDTQTIQKSQSDFTLTNVDSSNFTTKQISIGQVSTTDGAKVAYGNGLYVWVNKYAEILYSTDGENWTLNNSIKNSFSANPYIVYGNGYFVIGRAFGGATSPAQTAYAWYSNDAITWTPITDSSLNGRRITGIVYGNNNFVFCVNTWQSTYYYFPVFSPPSFSNHSDYNGYTAESVSSDTPMFYVQSYFYVGMGHKLIKLSRLGHKVVLDTSPYDTSGYYHYSMAYGNNKYVISYDRLYITENIDSPSWSYSYISGNGLISGLIYNSGYFLAIKGQVNAYYPPYLLYCSIDGTNWKALTQTASIWQYSNNYFVSFSNNQWILGNSSQIGYIQLFYSTTATKSISGNWLNSWTYTSQSSIRNVSVNSNHTQGTVTATVETYEPSLDITLEYILYSDNSTAVDENMQHIDNVTFAFTQGTIAAIKEVSRTTSLSATISNTTSAIIFSDISIATPNAQAETTVVNVKLAVIYNNLISGGTSGQDIILLNGNNAYSIKLYDTFVTDFSYGLKLSDNGTQIGTSELKPFIPSIGSYDILGKVFITPNTMTLVLYGEEVQGSTVSNSSDITYTQSAITSVELVGAQVVDYLYIQKNDIEQSDNQPFTPVWNENTLFFADFVEPEPNELQAGTVSATGEYQNAIYRIESGNVLKPIITLPTNVLRFKDYGIKSQQVYSYELFYLNSAQESGYSAPVQSEQVCRIFRSYSLIEATEDSQNTNVYHVLKVWRFGNNISAGTISNNNSPNWLTNFTPYRLRQPSSRLGESGTLQALLSNYNQSQNFYNDTAQMMQELKQASVSNNTFFLKDMKGNLYMVGISAPITQTINTKTQLQQVTISVPWEEVGDASNVSLIQLETDSGWQG